MERIATISGMWDRTVTFGSGGKTFGVTGWRIGWIVGPEHLLKYILAIHARTVFTTPTPLQEAVAVGLETTCTEGNDYFATARQEYQRRRDKAIRIFTDLGLPVAVPHGSYFFMVETSKVQVELPDRPSEEEAATDGGTAHHVPKETRDYALCRWLTTELGVTTIPPSAFYQPENKHLAENLLRVCFCKSDETLDAARERLQRLKPYIKK